MRTDEAYDTISDPDQSRKFMLTMNRAVFIVGAVSALILSAMVLGHQAIVQKKINNDSLISLLINLFALLPMFRMLWNEAHFLHEWRSRWFKSALALVSMLTLIAFTVGECAASFISSSTYSTIGSIFFTWVIYETARLALFPPRKFDRSVTLYREQQDVPDIQESERGKKSSGHRILSVLLLSMRPCFVFGMTLAAFVCIVSAASSVERDPLYISFFLNAATILWTRIVDRSIVNGANWCDVAKSALLLVSTAVNSRIGLPRWAMLLCTALNIGIAMGNSYYDETYRMGSREGMFRSNTEMPNTEYGAIESQTASAAAAPVPG